MFDFDKNEKPLILAFDTSCDDTSASVLRGRKILSNVVASQVELHKKWGGVVPMVARRAHSENIEPSMKEALKRAKVNIEDIDFIAVTYGPGLAIDLEVGVAFAKDLALKYGKKLVAVNHMEGHLLSSLALNSKGKGNIEDDDFSNFFPALALLISGGHTELVLIENFNKYSKIGETLDDAAGEAFDKVGRMMNFGYPGGPIVSEFAKKGKPGVFELPVPMKDSQELKFSFSGLKTACLYKIQKLRESGKEDKKWAYDFCYAFVDSVSKSLTGKTELAFKKYPGIKTLMVGGGVVNNEKIVMNLRNLAKKYDMKFYAPEKKLRTDNAAMIGIAGYYRALNGDYLEKQEDISALDRDPVLDI